MHKKKLRTIVNHKIVNSSKMKSISIFLKNIKNLLPYFLLIAIYFFFVNLEASKNKENNQKSEKEKILSEDSSIYNMKNLRIEIPVIPYNE